MMIYKEKKMKKIEWDDYSRVNFEQIDLQHHCFVNLANKIVDNIDNDQEIIEALCHELIAFAKFHFLSEENLMISSKYPKYREHKDHHNRILTKLNENIVGVQVEKDHVLELVDFLNEWFTAHINTDDTELGKYLNSVEVN